MRVSGSSGKGWEARGRVTRLDAGHDALVLQHLHEGRAIRRVLVQSLLKQDLQRQGQPSAGECGTEAEAAAERVAQTQAVMGAPPRGGCTSANISCWMLAEQPESRDQKGEPPVYSLEPATRQRASFL